MWRIGVYHTRREKTEEILCLVERQTWRRWDSLTRKHGKYYQFADWAILNGQDFQRRWDNLKAISNSFASSSQSLMTGQDRSLHQVWSVKSGRQTDVNRFQKNLCQTMGTTQFSNSLRITDVQTTRGHLCTSILRNGLPCPASTNWEFSRLLSIYWRSKLVETKRWWHIH